MKKVLASLLVLTSFACSCGILSQALAYPNETICSVENEDPWEDWTPEDYEEFEALNDKNPTTFHKVLNVFLQSTKFAGSTLISWYLVENMLKCFRWQPDRELQEMLEETRRDMINYRNLHGYVIEEY